MCACPCLCVSVSGHWWCGGARVRLSPCPECGCVGACVCTCVEGQSVVRRPPSAFSVSRVCACVHMCARACVRVCECVCIRERARAYVWRGTGGAALAFGPLLVPNQLRPLRQSKVRVDTPPPQSSPPLPLGGSNVGVHGCDMLAPCLGETREQVREKRMRGVRWKDFVPCECMPILSKGLGRRV